ncbi:MAG: class I SAM-dependent methyltransferase [Solirubrobacterales bacterium]
MILADQASDVESIWQLVESCAYGADLPIWSQLTEDSASVLDLGCGIGRVARHLADQGRTVVGVDRDAAMVANLSRLSTEDGISAIVGDVAEIASLGLGKDRFEAIIAPQQLLHIVGGAAKRRQLLAGVKLRLEPDGLAAFAISELVRQESQTVEILPDLREVGHSVYASRPVAVEADDDSLTVVRLRQVVDSHGSLDESQDRITLDLMDRDSLAGELSEHGLVVDRTIEIPETDRHIASVVVVARHDVRSS